MKRWMLLPLLALAGCAQIDNYPQAVKVPAPAGMAGVWQSDGPQSALVSPQAMASLLISPQGDTLDCRQWQRVIAKPGKLSQIDDELVNINRQLRVMPITLTNGVMHYDGLSLKKVTQPTSECRKALAESKDHPKQQVIQDIQPTLMQNHFADGSTAG
ncbi:lipoprotein YedD [Tatumella sp. JGM118]|uniref:Lipoprotein YedD n=1 Tax=Tatumella terrea TaxID=419007 RepID=A0ABW1VXJ4_9GAMM|nr:lipoprotein YedD [Tatumella sp. JGM118]MBS0908256.1 lipoprotein [Tatumella sp. JGM118]